MSKYLDKAKECRSIGEPKYNCSQSAAVPFAEAAGVDEEVVIKAAANFGGGMRMAATCGAFTGGLIALGLNGITDPAIITDYAKRIKEKHHSTLECAELLRINKEQGGEKKPHCDRMVFDCVQAVEDILRENNKIQ